MGYTIAEKILAAHAGGQPVRAGDVVIASVDFAMLHDARASNALKMIAKLGVESLPFASKTAIVLDHYSPPPNYPMSCSSATMPPSMRRFLVKYSTPARAAMAISKPPTASSGPDPRRVL